jgi:hypothetical protein
MLTENDILKILAKHLENQGFEIIQLLHTGQKGVDLIAQKETETMYIEAKGETSADYRTNRFGKSFSTSQIKDHIAKAILASLKIASEKPSGIQTKTAIAVPNNLGHKKVIDQILPILNQIDLKVYLVDLDTVVEL